MTVLNVNDLSIFKSRQVIDHDESWAIKLMNECEQENVQNEENLQDDIIFIDNHTVNSKSSTIIDSQKTDTSLENTCTPSAIEIQILAAKNTKKAHQDKLPVKPKKNLMTLFRNK